MESLSRTIDTYTGSYLIRRRRKRILTSLAVCAAVIILAVAAVELVHADFFVARSSSKPVSKQQLLSEWNAKSWDTVIAGSTASLVAAPLDPFYLMFKGFASFYKALELPEGDTRAALLDDSVDALRKAIATGKRLPLAQVEYVLGKAYYQKGPSYLDESVKYMEAAQAAGYSSSDSQEYLAMAYAGLGDQGKAIQHFQEALKKSRAELLLLAAAKAYDDSGDTGTAESLLLEALSTGKDALVDERCRFLLGDIYRSQGKAAKAEEQYTLIIQKNENSADAHYRLGLVYQDRGESVRARAEWRKAVAIDPTNTAAREKLTQKL